MPDQKSKETLALLGGEINGKGCLSKVQMKNWVLLNTLNASEIRECAGFSVIRRTIVIKHDKVENYGFYILEKLGFKMNFIKTRPISCRI